MARQRLVDGDPAADLAMAPILEWAKEVQATKRHQPGACSAGELARYWKAAQTRWGQEMGRHQGAYRRHPAQFAQVAMDMAYPIDIQKPTRASSWTC